MQRLVYMVDVVSNRMQIYGFTEGNENAKEKYKQQRVEKQYFLSAKMLYRKLSLL